MRRGAGRRPLPAQWLAHRRPPGSRLRRVLFDVAVALWVAAMSLLPLTIEGAPRSLAVVGLAMAATLLVRRRWPLPVLVAVAALALLQLFLAPVAYEPMPFDVAVVIAMYSVVTYAGPLWHGFVAAAIVAAGIAIEVVRHDSWRLGAVYAAGCAASWLAGYTVRVRRLYVVHLEERAATAERERDHLSRLAMADQRAAIARELHDIVAHSLAVMIVQADGAGYVIDSDREAARDAVRQIATTGRESLAEMHRLVGLLRADLHPGAGVADPGRTAEPGPVGRTTGAGPTEPDALPGGPRRLVRGGVALEDLADRAEAAGLRVTLSRTGDRLPVPDGVELVVYRIAQESVTNVLRHAGAGASVRIELAYTARSVRLEVRDDGGRHDRGPASAPHPPGHGLIGMRERVGVYGGQFHAGPDGTGWRVSATIPWSTLDKATPAAPATPAMPAGAEGAAGAAAGPLAREAAAGRERQ